MTTLTSWTQTQEDLVRDEFVERRRKGEFEPRDAFDAISEVERNAGGRVRCGDGLLHTNM